MSPPLANSHETRSTACSVRQQLAPGSTDFWKILQSPGEGIARYAPFPQFEFLFSENLLQLPVLKNKRLERPQDPGASRTSRFLVSGLRLLFAGRREIRSTERLFLAGSQAEPPTLVRSRETSPTLKVSPLKGRRVTPQLAGPFSCADLLSLPRQQPGQEAGTMLLVSQIVLAKAQFKLGLFQHRKCRKNLLHYFACSLGILSYMPPRQSTAEVLADCSPRDQALGYLLGRINYERAAVVPYGLRQMKLDRMRQLLNRLGNPDAGLPIVHVAGTKGKGSTSALVASILQSAGYEIGLFSSPHLLRMEERFAVGGHPCTAKELVSLVDRLRPVVQSLDQEAERAGDRSLSPTYFELTTALALLHFVDQKVDLAVLEVGLGGRLDSTNVCQPAVTVITSISLDHTKQLGNTLEEIAGEKAGIIKPGVPVYCGPLDKGPREVIARIAKQNGCRMFEAGRDFRYVYRPPRQLDRQHALGQLDFAGDFAGEQVELPGLPLQLVGEHQAANAALAVAVCEELRRQSWSISGEAMQAGLAKLALPARIEVIRRQPAVVLDVAHNVASAEALARVLQTSFACPKRTLILAASQDKDVTGIVRALLPHFRQVILTAYQDNPRAVPVDKLRQIVQQELQKIAAPGHNTKILQAALPLDAWQMAKRGVKRDQLICITGSFFIAAELRAALRAEA